MAIRLITGAPGSGKSFYCVHHLVENYYTQSGGVHVLKPGYTIICNVENFRPDHLKLDDIIKKSGHGVEGFFNVEYQKKIMEKHGKLVYIIDECQRYFDEYFRNKDVIYFFEYHRHLGIDIYLVSQSPNRICRAIRDLAENEIRAARRMVSLMGEMKYKVLVGGEQVSTKVLRRDKSIFALYQSMSGVESEKIRNPLLKWIPICLGIIVLGILGFYFTFFNSVAGASAPSKEKSKAKAVPSVGTVPAKAVPVERKLCSLDWIAVGDELYVLDMESDEMIPQKSYPGDLIVRKKGRFVVGVYSHLSGAALTLYRQKRATPPPSPGGGGRPDLPPSVPSSPLAQVQN